MRNFKQLIALSGLGVVLAFTGCQSWGNKDTERTEGRVVDDHRITAEIERELQSEQVYKFNDVDVKTFNGVVQLSGFVNSEDQKQRAGELAQKVPGVGQVVNSITLKPQIPTVPTGRTNGVTRP